MFYEKATMRLVVHVFKFTDSLIMFLVQHNSTKESYDKSCIACTGLKGERDRQKKLISSERPSKILQNETKIIKIGQAVFEIFNFKDWGLDNFTRENDRKTENVVFLDTEEQ